MLLTSLCAIWRLSLGRYSGWPIEGGGMEEEMEEVVVAEEEEVVEEEDR